MSMPSKWGSLFLGAKVVRQIELQRPFLHFRPHVLHIRFHVSAALLHRERKRQLRHIEYRKWIQTFGNRATYERRNERADDWQNALEFNLFHVQSTEDHLFRRVE